ncbi:MAG: DoxX family protein [Deltaproteobacteria bacterium]|nr:DoxX family protein [Deltaproteobacteria bacterium]
MLQKIFSNFKDYSLIPVRLALGWIFIAHGGQKLFGLWGGPGLIGFAGSLESLGLKPAIFWALLAGCTEFFGGLMVLLGIFSRWGALFIIGVMVVAVATVHWKNGLFLSNQGYEYNVALIGLALAILYSGSGRFSIKRD